MFNRNSFGRPRAAHGFDADREVEISSDLGEQGTRQREYESLARLLGGVAETAKSLANIIQTRQGSDDEQTHTWVATRCLKKARLAIRKAESSDEDDEGEGDEAEREGQIEKAENWIAKAKRNLLNAEEYNEPETDLAKAAATFRKVSKAVKDLKTERAAKAAAPMAAQLAAVSAKAEALQGEMRKFAVELGGVSRSGATDAEVARLSAKAAVLKGSLKGILALIGGQAAAAGPAPVVVKSETTDTPNYLARIASADATGSLTGHEVLQAKVIAGRLSAYRGDADARKAIESDIQHVGSAAIKAIFRD
jgi:NADH dehydrogenase/NADH:ubiquinone oxidoreductase subunit G